MGSADKLAPLAGLPPAALASLTNSVANDVQFSSTREAGTFRFTGSFDQGVSRFCWLLVAQV